MWAEKEIEEILRPSAVQLKAIIEKVRVIPGSAPTVEVTVDNPDDVAGAPSAQLLAEMSREFSQLIEKNNIFPESYIIRVSSPGVGRSFAEDRHWAKAVGRLVRLTMKDEEDIVAVLDYFDVSAREIVIRQKKPARKGFPVRYHEARTMSLTEIKQARAEVEF